jgi:hypothetical protein
VLGEHAADGPQRRDPALPAQVVAYQPFKASTDDSLSTSWTVSPRAMPLTTSRSRKSGRSASRAPSRPGTHSPLSFFASHFIRLAR